MLITDMSGTENEQPGTVHRTPGEAHVNSDMADEQIKWYWLICRSQQRSPEQTESGIQRSAFKQVG